SAPACYSGDGGFAGAISRRSTKPNVPANRNREIAYLWCASRSGENPESFLTITRAELGSRSIAVQSLPPRTGGKYCSYDQCPRNVHAQTFLPQGRAIFCYS